MRAEPSNRLSVGWFSVRYAELGRACSPDTLSRSAITAFLGLLGSDAQERERLMLLLQTADVADHHLDLVRRQALGHAGMFRLLSDGLLHVSFRHLFRIV